MLLQVQLTLLKGALAPLVINIIKCPPLEDQQSSDCFPETLHIGEVAGTLQRHLRKFLYENVSGNLKQWKLPLGMRPCHVSKSSHTNPKIMCVPYNGNHPRKKSFANFANLEAFANVTFFRKLRQRRQFAKLFFRG